MSPTTFLASLQRIFCGLCFCLMASTTANAFTLDFEEQKKEEVNGIDLFYETLKDTLPSLFFLEKDNEYFRVQDHNKEYFTLRLNKKEKFNASYQSGAYFINYSKNW